MPAIRPSVWDHIEAQPFHIRWLPGNSLGGVYLKSTGALVGRVMSYGAGRYGADMGAGDDRLCRKLVDWPTMLDTIEEWLGRQRRAA